MLSNILYFEDGSKFSGTCANGRSNKYRYYKCKGLKESILAEELQDRIIALLFKYIESNTRLQEIISESYKKRISNVAECDRNIRGLESQIKEQDKKLANFEKVSLGSLGPELINQRYEQFNIKRKNLELRLEGEHQRRKDFLSKHDINSIQAMLKKFQKCFSNSKGNQKRDLIEMLIKKVVVMKNNKLQVILKADSRSPLRGEIILDKERNGVPDSWYAEENGGRGFKRKYSDAAIEVLSMIRFQLHLTLRSTQGFAQSLLTLMGLDVEVPDYSTLSRRLASVDVALGKLKCGEQVHVVIDSTGPKVFGEGEWKVRQHWYSKRRTWRKLHLCVDESNCQILSASLTENSFKDNELFEDLVTGLQDHIDQASADGAYESKECWDHCQKNDIQGTFPPRKGAKLKQHGN